MNIDKRQQTLVILAAVAVGLLAGDRFVYTPLTSAWKQRAERIQDLSAKIARGKELLSHRVARESKWEQMRTNTLPSDSSVAEGLVLNSLRKWMDESGAASQSIKTQWKRDEDDYTLFECHVDVSGGLEALSKLLYAVESSPMALKVESVDLTTKDPARETVGNVLPNQHAHAHSSGTKAMNNSLQRAMGSAGRPEWQRVLFTVGLMAAVLSGADISAATTNDVSAAAVDTAVAPTNDVVLTNSLSVTNSVTLTNTMPGTNNFVPIETNIVVRSEIAGTNALPTISPTSWVAFKMVVDKNIFDGTREPRRARSDVPPPPKIVKVDWFELCGLQNYAKGMFAVFKGSSSDYVKVLREDGLIAGYRVASIAEPDKVLLESGGKKTELKMGMRLERRGNDAWKLTESPVGASESVAVAKSDSKVGDETPRGGDDSETADGGAEAKSTSRTEVKSSGGDDDVLKRLMRKREQE